MKRAILHIIFAITIIAFYSCQKPLDIKTTDSNANVLVVEGLINTADSTKVKLSRTVTVGNKITAKPESNAIITIENASGTVGNLTELSSAKGTYATQSLV